MCKQLTLFDNDKKALSVENISHPSLLRDIPFDRIYEAARKEASRKKPAFFLHKYFARRITSNFRMMLLGALLPYDEDIWDYLYDSFDNQDLKELVVLDPFMGGGTTVFEALRLNAKVIGSDLQPLSKFVTSALVRDIDMERLNKTKKVLEKNVASKIMEYYKTCCPECGEQADVMYSFHVKKVRTNCKCKEHRLFSNFVLALKKNEFTLVCPECGEVFKHNFKEDGPATCKCGFIIAGPKEGYVNHGVFRCKECGEEKIVSEYSREEGYPLDTDIIAIEYYCPHCNTHDYKRVDDEDRNLFDRACKKYDEIKDTLPIPNQRIPVGYNTNQILNHGYEYFSELFNKRQLLCLGMLLQEINDLDDESKFWLQLAFSGMLEMNNMFCRYQANAYKICNIFFNHAYVPISMPVENNVWGTKLGTGNFVKTLDKIIRGKKFCTNIYDISTIQKNGSIEVEKKFSNECVATHPIDNYEMCDENHPILRCGDSSDLSFIPDNSVDIVLTDPPFGANVMYSELIDFFHVWNYKSSLADELGFLEPVSPKEQEIIVNTVQGKTQKDYEDGLTRVFSECYKKLKDKGFLIFSFHDKSVDSWLSILSSIDSAGFKLIKAYPLHSETRTGAHTSNKNSIALDIMLICRKKDTENSALIDKKNLSKTIQEAYEQTEGILNRLTKIDAEITIPDIENIFISEVFSVSNNYGFSYSSVLEVGLDSIKECIEGLNEYFSNYEISNRRSGWWSELFKEKWEV